MLPNGRDVFYELRLANGSSIPDYLTFNSKAVTLDGVVPPPDQVTQPLSSTSTCMCPTRRVQRGDVALHGGASGLRAVDRAGLTADDQRHDG